MWLELSLLIIFLVIYYYYFINNWNYWSSQDVVGPKPSIPFGTVGDIVIGKHNLGTYLQEIYTTYKKSKLVGVYRLRKPILIVNDLDLIKDVLIKDFSKFADRGREIHDKHEALAVNLFNLEPQRWRPLRSKLTPMFTSVKLKDMFYLLVQCADQMETYLDKFENGQVDMREIATRFTTDVIGVCVFGLQANALAEEDSLFRKMGKRIFELNIRNVGRTILGSFLPELYKVVGYFFRDSVLDNFFIGITKDTMDYRRKNRINRHDFVDLLIELKDEPSKVGELELTDKVLAAQLFVFFAAGFETSSTTIGNALYEMALNHSVQEKLRQEIKDELIRTDGKFTYEGVKNMKYLDKVFLETLRKYPPLPFLTRRSMEPYTFTGTNLTIPAKTEVWIPMLGIQRDPEYYPNPSVFNPEHFSEEQVKSRHDMTFLSFGDGPRNCIGARFGLMQTKIGVITVLRNHTVDICDKTDHNYEVDHRAFLLVPKNGIFLNINRAV
ncbi:GSCOCT00010402001.2-RA-CDS [Cotesia congregata]|uniref:CYP6AS68 n=1 Tax=Cotesia congregata TaxID=51543 RepID=A0A8J2HEI7_COTCN|nr:GSCOCT00010402001.2-RA-CDS [Cotesia congregata]CAG5092303.1 CYP6AS68 [Cotesia congregata]